jgi:phosphatidate cytidylyltransferase
VAAAILYPILECYRIREGWTAGSLDGMFLFAFLLMLFGRAVLGGHVEVGLDRIGRTLLGFVLLYLFYRLVPILLDPALGGGLYVAYLLVFTSKSCDIGAYLVGRTFGKRKLIPKVSPGKTVAGAVGGLSFCTAVGGVAFTLQTGWPVWYAILFGLVVGAVTMLSDLAESLVKRCSSVKDSAALLPEMGGILDLIDSLFLAAPTGYVFLWVFQLFLKPA